MTGSKYKATVFISKPDLSIEDSSKECQLQSDWTDRMNLYDEKYSYSKK